MEVVELGILSYGATSLVAVSRSFHMEGQYRTLFASDGLGYKSSNRDTKRGRVGVESKISKICIYMAASLCN